MTDTAGPDSVPALPGCTDLVLIRSGIPRVYRCLRQGTAVSALVYPVRVDAGTATAFHKQVKALQGVNHPHVAPVLESGLADGYPYLISTADNGTLTEQMRDHLRSPADLAVLGRQLAEGLGALHSVGLIHGGLTPGAVVLLPDGRPQVSALTLGLGQHTGHAALNSPSQLYVAPETLRDGTLTAASDLYALGAVLHAAVSGKPPLAARMGETAGEHILRVLNEPPARLDVLPDSFAALIARLLEKDPGQRPPSAEGVATSLAALTIPPIPAVRPVAAPASTSAKKTAPAAGRGATPQLPRPARLSRKHLQSWPPATPPATPPTAPPTAPPSAPPAAPPVHPAAAQPAAAQPAPAQPAAAQPPVGQPALGQPAPGAAAAAHAGPGTQTQPAVTPAPSTATPPAPAQPQAPAAAEPAHSGGKRRNWLLAAGGVVVAAVVITALALVNHKGQADQPPIAGQTPTQASTPALVVRLDPPADHSTYVVLTWSGPSDVDYAVVVAQAGQPADTRLVFKQTKYRVAVVPGIQYCFAIQATDGVNRMETPARPIRDAQCQRR
ncbi:protein kinase domain-containing protein [Kribbella sp. NPDC054772]